MIGFKLNSKFLEEYKGKAPPFGPLGAVTFSRTYSRKMENGKQETWTDTIQRVVEGCYSIQKDHCRDLGLEWDNDKSQRSAQEMYRRMWDLRMTPPGRGLWTMGTSVIEKTPMAAFNCAFISTHDLSVNIAEPFCWAMDALMLGCGVGFDSRGAGSIVVKEPRRGGPVFEVPDTREGWVEALRVSLMPFAGKGAIPSSFDYSKVRPFGEPINGFGGTASGPGPLKELLECADRTLTGLVGQHITVTAINDIMNFIGRCVVAGNVRRSAELSLGNYDDDEFLNLKNPETNQDRLMSHGWVSNNSIFATKGMDYTRVAEMTAKNGEPGYVWLDNCRKFGRMNDPADNKDYRVMGVNPCQPATATVLTPEGIKTFADIDVGSTIWSGKQWTKVVNKWATGVKPVFQYDTKAGRFVGTENHRIFQNGERCEVGQSDSIDTCQGPAPSVTINPQDVMDGLVIGDGVRHSGKYVHLIVGSKDQDYLTSEVSGLIHGSPDVSKPTYRKVTTSIQFDDMVLLPERAIPARFVQGSVSTRAGFLRGLYSANGSLAGNRVTLKATSFKIISQTQDMLSSLGIRSYYTTNKSSDVTFSNGTYTCKQSYDLNVSTDRTKFAEIIGFIQQYKTDKLLEICSNVGTSKFAHSRVKNTYEICEITSLGDQEVFDITVDADEHSYWTGGLLVSNCSEIVLDNAELCNLVEIYPSNHVSKQDFLTTLKYAYLYSKTVTLLKTHSPRANAVMQRNRRIGCSLSGIVQAVTKFGRRQFFDMCDEGYTYLKELDREYSEWLCIPRSIKMTTVKPSGSVSLLAGTTSGIHFAHSEYYIRRIRFQENSPLLTRLEASGYPVEIDAYSKNTKVVSFPIKEENYDRGKFDVSMWEQLELTAQMQGCWADNAVSVTVTVKPEEMKDVKYALELYESRLKAVSFLPLEDHKYVQAPYETISKEKYEEMMSSITPVTSFEEIESHEVTERFCTNDVCEIVFKK